MALFLILAVLTYSLFFLGGAIACLTSVLRHDLLAAKSRNVNGAGPALLE